MSSSHIVVTEQIHARCVALLEFLDRDANAKLAFLIDKSGQQIAAVGEMDDIDPTSLAALTAGNVAATEGVAQLVGEDEFSSLYHEGKKKSIHITVVAKRLILLVVFDEHSSLGLVRLRVGQCVPELAVIVDDLMSPPPAAPIESQAAGSPGVDQITDADIDALFGD